MTARIQTYSGLLVDPLHLSIQDIRLEDIAHALSNLCRFTGHVKRFYSVAEHSVRCSWYAHSWAARDALMHDASEAYLQDLPSPIKRVNGMEKYRAAEGVAQKVISRALGAGAVTTAVKAADLSLLHFEAFHLMDASWADEGIVMLVESRFPDWSGDLGWSPERAKQTFIDCATILGIR